MQNKRHTVQIDKILFYQLYCYFCWDNYLDGYTEEQYNNYIQEIRAGLEEKFNKMYRRDEFTKYKTAPTAEEREKARQEYLDEIGMREEFRW